MSYQFTDEPKDEPRSGSVHRHGRGLSDDDIRNVFANADHVTISQQAAKLVRRASREARVAIARMNRAIQPPTVASDLSPSANGDSKNTPGVAADGD